MSDIGRFLPVGVRPTWKLSRGSCRPRQWSTTGESNPTCRGQRRRDGRTALARVNRSSSPCISAGRGLNSGERRPWFLCPLCISRVALLYLRGESWACRRCHDLRYQSELEPKGRRGLMMARKIQVRLGGKQSGLEFPPKPPRMHQRSYQRALKRHQAALAKSWSGLGWSRLARRLGLR